MPSFQINFGKVIQENILKYLRTPRRLDRLMAMVKPFKVIYIEFTNLTAEYTYKCRFNGQMIYLETALNDRFDPVNRAIYIDDAFFPKTYIYKRSEARPPLIMYRKWQSSISFATGKFCYYQGDIYVANSTALNKIPGTDPEWTIQPARSAPFIRKQYNYNGELSFYVMVPVSLVFSTAEMKALINYYKIAGPGYLIKTF